MVCTIVLSVMSFQRSMWFCSWFCLSPVIWMWRLKVPRTTLLYVVCEATAVGFLVGWELLSFVQTSMPTNGFFIRVIAAGMHSGNFICVGLAAWLTRKWHPFLATIAIAAGALAGEFGQFLFGVSWPVTNLALPIINTPIAQLAGGLSVFGLSMLVYLINTLWVMDFSAGPVAFRRMVGAGPLAAITLFSSAWLFGEAIEKSVRISPPELVVMLVQPNLKTVPESAWCPWITLDRLTQLSLARHGKVDLIVWPEESLSPSMAGETHLHRPEVLTLDEFAKTFQSKYQANCLVGVKLTRPVQVRRSGLSVTELRTHNCGCMVASPARIECHDKIALVPLVEELPWFLTMEPVRQLTMRLTGFEPKLMPGSGYHALELLDLNGSSRRVSVAVCFETFFPFLPQYRSSDPSEFIVHLWYDGDSAAHPEIRERQLSACRYRAIETRKWQFVASTWAGTAIIAPSGTVTQSLTEESGVLRTDVNARNSGRTESYGS